MSDLYLYELEDNVWDEFGETDDHIVPHPGNRQGDQSSVDNNCCRKLQSGGRNVVTSAKNSVPGKEKRDTKPVNDKSTMLEDDTWSHTPDGVFSLHDTESTKGVSSIACDDARAPSHPLISGNVESDGCRFSADDPIMGDRCTADDNVLYRLPHSGSDLSFFDNEQEEKDNGDLLYYGWPDIGNFEDVDRMFRSCDLTFGMQSLNNDDELCWFPPSNAAERSEGALKSGFKISGQNGGWSKGVSDHNETSQMVHGSNKKNVSVGSNTSSQKTDYNNPASFGGSSFINEVDTEFESKDILMPTEQMNVCTKQQKHYSELEGDKADQYLETGVSYQHYDSLKQSADMKHPRVELSVQVYSESDGQQHKQSAGPDLMSYDQRQYMHLDYSNHSDQSSVCLTPSGSKSENNGSPSPSLKGSYSSNQLQSLESSHGLSIDIPTIKMSTKRQTLQSSQGFLSPFPKNFEKLTTTSPMVCGGQVLNQKKMHSKNLVEGQNEVEGSNTDLPSELASNVPESSCMSTMMDDISLEATSFRHLQQVMQKLDVRTKLCIRDSLYRLARSAEHRHNCADQSGDRENGGGTGELIVEDTDKCTDFMDIETDTNPIDRSIAHLLFHRSPDPSRVPSNDSLSLRSHVMMHDSVSSPKVMAQKQVFHEETIAGEEEMLLTGNG